MHDEKLFWNWHINWYWFYAGLITDHINPFRCYFLFGKKICICDAQSTLDTTFTSRLLSRLTWWVQIFPHPKLLPPLRKSQIYPPSNDGPYRGKGSTMRQCIDKHVTSSTCKLIVITSMSTQECWSLSLHVLLSSINWGFLHTVVW